MKRLLIILFLLPLVAWGQQLTVEAPQEVLVGQNFTVRFRASGPEKGELKVTSMGGLKAVSNLQQLGVQQSTTIINGQRSHEVGITYQLMAQGAKEGTYTIEATYTVDGKSARAQSQPVSIVKSASAKGPGNTSGASAQGQKSARAGQTLFRVNASKTNPYVGEEVILNYSLYVQSSIEDIVDFNFPKLGKFWVEDLKPDFRVQWNEQMVDGKRYQVGKLMSKAVYGIEAGKQTLSPLPIDVMALVPVQQRINTFFGPQVVNTVTREQQRATTSALTLNVRPLPEVPAGKVHHGGVGQFKAKAEVDQSSVKANEAITYKLTVSGRGNLVLLEAPEVEFPKGFEVYEPKVTDNLSRTGSGVSGSRTFEWVLIPQSAGKYQIPSLDYTWFNPQTGRYESAPTAAIPIEVAKGHGGDALVSTSQSDVKRLNSDINHIKTRYSERRDYITPAQLILLGLIPLAALIIILLGRKRQNLQADEVSLRQHQALKRAKKRLRAAEKALQEGTESRFYEEIYKALWGCLSDKYSIPISQLNHETVGETLAARHIPEEQHALVMRTLQAVDEARFAPGDATPKMQEIYQTTLNCIATL